MSETPKRVEESREKVEERMSELRRALRREFGTLPRAIAWSVPLVGFAAGLAAAKRIARGRTESD